jgi:DNA-binding PucR family transcriptional regulator
MKPVARARATETLRAWLAAHGDVTATARVLHIHPQPGAAAAPIAAVRG